MKLFACSPLGVTLSGGDLVKWNEPNSPQSLASGETERTEVRFPVSIISCFRESRAEDPSQVRVRRSWRGDTEEGPRPHRSTGWGQGRMWGSWGRFPVRSVDVLAQVCKVPPVKIPRDCKHTSCYFCPSRQSFSYSRSFSLPSLSQLFFLLGLASVFPLQPGRPLLPSLPTEVLTIDPTTGPLLHEGLCTLWVGASPCAFNHPTQNDLSLFILKTQLTIIFPFWSWEHTQQTQSL